MKKAIIRNVLKVFAVGGAAALLNGIAALLGYLSVMLYCYIPKAGGYLAVVFFALATLAAVGALAVVFMCGAWIVRKGAFSK